MRVVRVVRFVATVTLPSKRSRTHCDSCWFNTNAVQDTVEVVIWKEVAIRFQVSAERSVSPFLQVIGT